MNDDELILDRIRNLMAEMSVEWTEKRMFGGQCFMVDDKMLLGTFGGTGISKDGNGILARVGAANMEDFLEKEGVEPMVQRGRPMKDYIVLQSEAYEHDEQLSFWIKQCLEFNPLAKASRKKKPKK